MALEPIDFINGGFGILAIIFGIVISIQIFSRYLQLKRRVYLIMGFVTIIITEPWWPHSVSLIYALVSGKETGIIPELYFIIGNILIPLGVLLWACAFGELMNEKLRKLFIIIATVYLIIFEILFFFMLFTEPTLIGELQGAVHVKYNYGLLSLLISGMIIVLITCIMFFLESRKSNNPEVRLRGKFIFIGILILFIGATMEGFLSTILAFLILSRILLIISGFIVYCGFITPEWAKKYILRQKEEQSNEKI